jgi:quinoprotein glucose dehydrogenase
VPGEATSPTQPRPNLPAPIARQRLDESTLTVRTPAAHEWALEQFRNFVSDGQFVPMAVNKPTVVFPGFDGGAEWGGAAVDPRRGILYINANDVAWTGSVVPTVNGGGLGSALYEQNCSSCHGPERKGSPPAIPSLIDVSSRLSGDEVASVIRNGRGRMPPFSTIQSYFLSALITYATTGEESTGAAHPAPPALDGGRSDMQASIVDDPLPAAYRFAGFVKFLDPDGYPAVKPPWGTLNAIDMNSGRFLWTVSLGSYPELSEQGIRQTGSENYGGPMLTSGGVLFIGATIYDRKLHAYDARSGALLWEGALPYSGTATPATYQANGKQYVVIATSNGRTPGAAQGGGYVAFALPDGWNHDR